MFSIYSILSLVAAALAVQCPFPEIPKNGYAEMDGLRITFDDAEAVTFHAKDVVKYSCDSEWALFSNDSQHIGCQEDGTWKGAVPKCYLRETTEIWTKIISEYDIVVFKSNSACYTTYSEFRFWPRHKTILLSGVKEVNVRLCDPVSGNDRLKVKLKGRNKTVDCGFQFISYEGHKFTCKQDISNETLEFIRIEPAGSRISIKEATILLSTGDDCGSPAIPVNGKAKFISEHRYWYTCGEGFELRGDDYVECYASTGQWSAVPTCERNDSVTETPSFDTAISENVTELCAPTFERNDSVTETPSYDTVISENATEEMAMNETFMNETEILENTTEKFDVRREEGKVEVSGAAGLNSSHQLHSMWMALCLFCLLLFVF